MGALDEMVAQAAADCYNDSECVTGFYTMLDEHLDVAFQATVLEVDVTVTGIDVTRPRRSKRSCWTELLLDNRL